MTQSDIKLIEYILGNANVKQDAELAQLLELPETNEQIAKLGNSLEVMANGVESVSASADLKARILSSVTGVNGKKLFGFSSRLSDFFKLSIDRIQEILNTVSDLNLSHWHTSRSRPGVSLQHFPGGGNLAEADCGLVHLDAGVSVDRHEHLGDEWMFILDGFIDADDGRQLAPGDILYSESGSQHAFQVSDDQACVFAVIVFEGIRWVK